MEVLIKDAWWVITMDPERRVIKDGSVVVRGDRIAAVGDAAAIARDFAGARFDRVIDASRSLVMPGFVDAHLHLSEHLSRGLIPDTAKTVEWVYDYAKPFYSSLDDEDDYVSTLFACLDMIKSGTSCFIDQGIYNPGMRSVEAMERIGIRGIVGRHGADKPPAHAPSHWKPEWLAKQYASTDATLKELERVIRQCHGAAGGRIRAWANIEGKVHHTTDALYRGAKALADQYGVGTMYHLASSVEEAHRVEQETGRWPVGHAYDIGALGRNVLLAHAVAVKDEEIPLLAETRTNIAFCPGTSLKLAKGSTRIGAHDRMAAAGVNVALGCDGTSAWGSFDMVVQAHLVAGLYKDARMDPHVIPAGQALEMATINGARALLWDDEIGSLEPGKKADLILFDLDRPEWTPCHDLVQTLVYSASGQSVHTVLIDGRVVLEQYRLTTMDEGEILAAARRTAEKLARLSGLAR